MSAPGDPVSGQGLSQLQKHLSVYGANFLLTKYTLSQGLF